MYRLAYHKLAIKALSKMPRSIADRIRSELGQIAKNPSCYSGDWKPLAATTNFWRLRVGSWRAICELREDELVLYVLKVGSRGDIYK